MKKKSTGFFVIIGLVLASIGFGNFLVKNGGLGRILTAPLQKTNTKQVILGTNSQYQVTVPTPSPTLDPNAVLVASAEPIATLSYTLTATQSGQTAFALLLSQVPNVKYKQYDFGNFIESINGVAGNNDNFWAFYLNGEKSTAGADAVVLKKGEVAEFKYEKIEF